MSNHKSTDILAVCLNSQEVDTLVPIGKSIEEVSTDQIRVNFCSLDNLYCHSVDKYLNQFEIDTCDLPFPIDLERHYNDSRIYEKVVARLLVPPAIGPVIDEYDGLLTGVETLPTSALMYRAKKLKIPIFQVLPYFYENLPRMHPKSKTIRHLKDFVKKKFVSKLPYQGFLQYRNDMIRGQADHIFTSGERVTQNLLEAGYNQSRYHTTGIPRYKPLFNLQNAATDYPQEGVILYITGAFHKHIGYRKLHNYQQNQIRYMAERISSGNTFTLHVKIHPREDISEYDWLERYKKVKIIRPETDPYEAVLNADIVTTIRSNLAYESAIIMRPVILTRFPNDPFEGGMMSEHFKTCSSVEELIGFAKKVQNDNEFRANEISEGLRKTYEVIDPRTPNSSNAIANIICDVVS